MSRSRFDEFRNRLSRRATHGFGTRRLRPNTVLLMALGAVTGVAIGMVIADRVGGVRGLLRPNGGRKGTSRVRGNFEGSISGWHRDDARSHDFDRMVGDDSELSPESLEHMRRRSAEHAVPASAVARDRAESEVSAHNEGLRGSAVPDEAALEARVLEAFINDPILRERAIDICASGAGTIELTGWVQASAEIAHALTLARGVPDVSAVVDRLAVRGGAPARDHSGFRYAGPPPGSDAESLHAE